MTHARPTSRITRAWLTSGCLLTATLIAAVPQPVRADGFLDCTIPTRERGDRMTSASGAAFRAASQAVERIAKANVGFMAGNRRPIRVRTTIDSSLERPHTAIINTVAYTEKAWVKGRCDVIPQADRGGDLSEGAIHVILNDPRSFLTTRLGNSSFEAYEEPVQTGEHGGFPMYHGMYVLVSRSGRVPWVPVTVAEALAYQESLMQQQVAEWEADKRRPWTSEAAIQQSYEAMVKIDATAAEKTRAALVKVMQDEKVQRTRMEAETDARLARQAAAWRGYRAALAPAQLQSQASLGVVGPDGIVRVDDPRGRRMVKVDPAFAALPPGQVHLVRVFLGDWPNDPVPGRTAWMRQVNATLDIRALAALAGR